MKNRILICFGTRPEWIKIKRLVEILSEDSFQLYYTGQHKDLLEDFDPRKLTNSSQVNNRLDCVIIDSILNFPEDEFSCALVQGDTGSAFACALAAFNRKIPIFYLEAGLRSHDLNHPFPEEAYRQMIARIADFNLCPTELSKQNLENEAILGKSHVVGNTILDQLKEHKTDCQYGKTILVTLHRRENHRLMPDWFRELNAIAMRFPKLEFVIPLHPNPNVQKHRPILTHLKVIAPMEHGVFLKTLVKSRLVITDSGGLQEEASFFNKKAIVCRTNTERPEAIETGHLHLCPSPNELSNKFDELIEQFEINAPCPYGDGNSSNRIKTLIVDHLENRSTAKSESIV